MDAGIPIKRHISGVAMGLMMNSDDDYKILTDIQGPEDHYGDMDCKVAGTEKGVTAVQMDVKIEGVSLAILKKVFSQAKEGRSYILDEMNKTIKEPRESLSPFAPRVFTLKINPDKIGIVIGPGGKMINEIINQTGVKIDVEDDGLVNISSDNEESAEKALEWVKNLTREVKPGEIFQGKVVKITDFGAFVEIIVGQEGLVHISELAPYRVEKVEDVVKTGQIVTVKVKNIDQSGRISLTMKNIDSPYPYSKKE
jgi:polyribonucleotide nucleotidyltransferase